MRARSAGGRLCERLQMNNPIISVSGIRGILGSSLTPEIILKYASAFARFTERKRIVIGRDGRLFGDLIMDMVVSVLSLSGCEVIDLDIVPTPTIALAVRYFKVAAGISITASHNPQEWNGMKFLNQLGIFLNEKELKTFLKFAALSFPSRRESSSLTLSFPRKRESLEIKDIIYAPDFFKYHISKVLSSKFVNVPKIRKRKFKVVLDCLNASGSFIIPELLKKLGCSVIKVDCDASGVFTRNPEPIPQNIKRTCAIVKNSKADLGIVVDPDADRLVIITEKGEPYGEELTIATAINHVFKHVPENKRVAVVNLSTTRTVDDIVKKHNGKLFKSPVGEINVIRKMKRHHAVIGGEGSGGVIFPEINYCRDSLAGIGLLLSEFAESGMSVSAYKKTLPAYHIVKDKIQLNHSGYSPDELINKISRKYKKFKQNNEDGLRLDFPNSWINFRKSNTEPIIRIIAEAKTRKLAEELMNNTPLSFPRKRESRPLS